jgi:hypothetical protein
MEPAPIINKDIGKIDMRSNIYKPDTPAPLKYYATSGFGTTYKISEDLAFKRAIAREYRRNRH